MRPVLGDDVVVGRRGQADRGSADAFDHPVPHLEEPLGDLRVRRRERLRTRAAAARVPVSLQLREEGASPQREVDLLVAQFVRDVVEVSGPHVEPAPGGRGRGLEAPHLLLARPPCRPRVVLRDVVALGVRQGARRRLRSGFRSARGGRRGGRRGRRGRRGDGLDDGEGAGVAISRLPSRAAPPCGRPRSDVAVDHDLVQPCLRGFEVLRGQVPLVELVDEDVPGLPSQVRTVFSTRSYNCPSFPLSVRRTSSSSTDRCRSVAKSTAMSSSVPDNAFPCPGSRETLVEPFHDNGRRSTAAGYRRPSEITETTARPRWRLPGSPASEWGWTTRRPRRARRRTTGSGASVP